MGGLLADRGPFELVLCCEGIYQQPQEALDALLETLRALVQPGCRLVFAYQQRDGAEVTDAAFFEALTLDLGLCLLEEIPLDPWDESWDDSSCRRVRVYAFGAGTQATSARQGK